MQHVARAAGCSRGTVYRYFPTRDALRRAYVEREAARIGRRLAESVGAIDDPEELLLRSMTGVLRDVRAHPNLRAWFTAEASGTTATLAFGSPATRDLTAGFLDRLLAHAEATDRLRPGLDRRAAGEWLVRTIVSLLAVPARRERELLRTCLVPVFLGPPA